MPKWKKAAKSKSGKKAAAELPAITESVAAFERLSKLAQAIPASEITPFRANAKLAAHNVAVGLAAVAPHAARLKKEIPALSYEAVAELPEIAAAVLYAARQVVPLGGIKASIDPIAKRASELRAVMLAGADAAAAKGLLPKAKVAAIHAGTGQTDLARDCIDLAALFSAHAASLRGKTAITAADVKEADEVGRKLLALLTPKGAKKPSKVSQAVEIRDRLWTLLLQRHRDLFRAGAWLYGPEVSRYVPSLLARDGASKRAGKGASKGTGKNGKSKEAPQPSPVE